MEPAERSWKRYSAKFNDALLHGGRRPTRRKGRLRGADRRDGRRTGEETRHSRPYQGFGVVSGVFGYDEPRD